MRLRGLVTLKDRREFVRVRLAGSSASSGGLRLQAAASSVVCIAPCVESVRVGFTVSKKCGGSVIRNRIRRRLRVVAQSVLATRARKEFCYVLVSSSRLSEATVDVLHASLTSCLKKLRLYL